MFFFLKVINNHFLGNPHLINDYWHCEQYNFGDLGDI